MICLISFNKFLDASPAFICASATGILSSTCLGVNILRPSPYFALYLVSDKILKKSSNNFITFSRDS